MKVATGQHKVLSPGEGLRLQSGPGRDLIFKVTGEDTGGHSTISSSKSHLTAVLRYTCTTSRKKRST